MDRFRFHGKENVFLAPRLPEPESSSRRSRMADARRSTTMRLGERPVAGVALGQPITPAVTRKASSRAYFMLILDRSEREVGKI